MIESNEVHAEDPEVTVAEARPCPDFDREFERFTHAWLRKYASKYNGDLARMESRIPDLYVRWLNIPAPWLNGQTPGLYFAGCTDPAELLEWAADYARADVALPAPLTDRLISMPGVEDALMRALADVATPYTLRLTIVSMLSDLKSVKPLMLYIKWIAHRAPLLDHGEHVHREDDLAEICAEALTRMGAIIVEPILAAAPEANLAGQETFLDILCNFPGDERIVELGLSLFERKHGSTALIAAYLGKLGDPRALPSLERSLNSGRLSYLDYIEVRNAAEALGGDAPSLEPDFAGDPDYESLKMLDVK
ncbi:MAG: hypothetical protein LBB86_02860 [Oscillospiraceae bacterium]|jgi:hypothetical protein|nr:hypothetical protein [Oscillospiraceae bacterium]